MKTIDFQKHLHNRTDLGGHTYGNKNDIVYSALGRIWIPRVYSNANSNAPLSSGTSVQSSILINNVGQSVDTTAAQNLDILPVPGKFLHYRNTPSFQCVAGDAKDAYSYAWSYLFGGYTGDHPLLGGSYTKVMNTLNSYRYGKYYAFDDIPLYNKLTQGDYSWATGSRYYRTVSTPWLNGVVNKVFRTVAMVTDQTIPYVLIADDVQKDNNVNNYKWIAQLANDLTIENTVVNLSNTNYRNDIIFKEPAGTGNRRFLIRILNNTGAVSSTVPAYVDSIQNPVNNLSPNNKLPRLVVESNSIDPKFKIMFFAYNVGDALPVTTWTNNNKDRLFVTYNGINKTVLFTVDTAGRTNIDVQDGLLPLAMQIRAKLLNQQTAKVEWDAKDQTNVKGYALEKSIDGQNFTQLTYLAASTLANDAYQFTDNQLASGANFYRIKAIHKDGSFVYSAVAAVKWQTKAGIKIYPNPAIHQQLQFIATNVDEGMYTLQITNMQSEVIMQRSLPLQNNLLNTISIAQLPSGAYRLTLINANNKLAATFIKQP